MTHSTLAGSGAVFARSVPVTAQDEAKQDEMKKDEMKHNEMKEESVKKTKKHKKHHKKGEMKEETKKDEMKHDKMKQQLRGRILAECPGSHRCTWLTCERTARLLRLYSRRRNSTPERPLGSIPKIRALQRLQFPSAARSQRIQGA